MTALRIALRILWGDRRTRTSAILMGVGVAVATSLMLVLVSLPGATHSRADRTAWQEGFHSVDDPDNPPMLIAVSEDFHGERHIRRVDVAAYGDPSDIELPPGVERFPGPGEVLLSPALRDLAAELPGSVLAERFPGEVVGLLGTDALLGPDQLVALVGHTPEELAHSGIPVDGFALSADMVDPLLGLLAGVGVVVLLVPSLVLVASAARLTATRREKRLAALRLAGATPRQVVAMVAGENLIAAVGGALFGWAVNPLLRPLVAQVPWQGGTWQAADFALPASLSLSVVAGVPLLVLLAAVLGLRRVVRAPLGAANAHRPRRPHWVRLLSLPAAGVLFFVLLRNMGDTLGAVLLLGALGLVIGSSMVIGPWVTAAIGAVFARSWRKPSVLLAGRRLRHDPKGAYRSSAGVVLAVFTGSMALTLLASFESLAGSSSSFRDSVLYVHADGVDAEEIAERTNEALARYGQNERALTVDSVELVSGDLRREAYVLDCETAERFFRIDPARTCGEAPGIHVPASMGVSDDDRLAVAVDPDEPGTPLPADIPVREVWMESQHVSSVLFIDPAVVPDTVEPARKAVLVTSTPDNVEVVRTALARSADGRQVGSVTAQLVAQETLLGDLRRVTVIGLVAAALLSGCSAAITTAGSVLDRRRTFGALMAAGTPVRTLSKALRTEAAMPALVATIGAGAVGVVIGIGLLYPITTAPPVITPWVLAPVVLGIVTAVIAASVCTPALKRVSAEPLSDE